MKNLAPEQDAESRRIAALLQSLIDFSGRSVHSVKEELGGATSFLTQVLEGETPLQFGDILKILDVLQVTPGQFFHVAYSARVRASGKVKQWRRSKEMDGTDKTLAIDLFQVVREIYGELPDERDPDDPHRQ